MRTTRTISAKFYCLRHDSVYFTLNLGWGIEPVRDINSGREINDGGDFVVNDKSQQHKLLFIAQMLLRERVIRER